MAIYVITSTLDDGDTRVQNARHELALTQLYGVQPIKKLQIIYMAQSQLSDVWLPDISF
jgi:hypothetical protein